MLSMLGIFLLLLVVLFFILPLFISKSYTIEKQILINKSNLTVFDYVKLFENQAYYNKWVMMDPNVKRTGTGTDGTPGYIITWDSLVKSVGKGEQEITGITPGSHIQSTVRFERPFKNTARVEMLTEAAKASETKLTWKMYGQNKYPMNIMNLFVPGLLGKDMMESLANLKQVLEK